MKKIIFSICLLLGIIVSIGIPYFFYQVDNLALYIALVSLSTSTITAVYSILAVPDPNKATKREIYGQLLKVIKEDISDLENEKYQNLPTSPYDNMQLDGRNQFIERELRERLDRFQEGVNQYNSAVEKVNFEVLPELIRDSADEVFNISPDTANLAHLYLFIGKKNRKPLEITIEIREHLKKKHSLSDVVDFEAEMMKIKKEEITHLEWHFQYSGKDTQEKKSIEEFWTNCLRNIDSIPEYKLLVKENNRLLNEAKEIEGELIKRIEKTIKS